MKLAVIGDFNSTFRPHVATNEAISDSTKLLNIDLQAEWIPTNQINSNFETIVKRYKGFWIAPGSPYNNMEGVLRLIQYARINNIPTFGTCGGFQHMVIEFARNVLNIKDAQHAEYDPYASKLVVNPLSCDLKGSKLDIEIIDKKSQTYRIFKETIISEKYYCNFGLNPDYQQELNDAGFRVVGSDVHNEARIMELENHIFFIATLFVPQDNSSEKNPHKLITTFLKIVNHAN